MAFESRWFTQEEFRCGSGEEYPDEWVETRLASLCVVLDAIREAWGGPLTVVSGYRSPEYNARLAAKSADVAKNSQHVQGRAADIRPANPTPGRVAKLHSMIRAMYDERRIVGLGGLGLYPGWVHVDVRPSAFGRLATWNGHGVGSEPVG